MQGFFLRVAQILNAKITISLIKMLSNLNENSFFAHKRNLFGCISKGNKHRHLALCAQKKILDFNFKFLQ